MIEAILVIFVCQLVGEIAAQGLSLPVPGPVLGLVLLFVGLQVRGRVMPAKEPVTSLPLGTVAAFLIANLSLLFIPAGAGIVSHFKTLSSFGVGFVVTLLVSTALTLVVTSLVFTAVARRLPEEGDS